MERVTASNPGGVRTTLAETGTTSYDDVSVNPSVYLSYVGVGVSLTVVAISYIIKNGKTGVSLIFPFY